MLAQVQQNPNMKVAYITNGFSGNLNCSYELFRRMQLAGHEVVYLSFEDVSQRVEKNGYAFIKLAEESQLQASMTKISSALPLTPQWFANRKHKASLRTQMLQSKQLLATLAELQADVLVIDIELHFVVLVCLRLGMPIILTIGWFSIFNDEMLPPMHTTLFPPETEQQKQAIKAHWQKENNSKRKKRLRRHISHRLKDFFSPSPISSQTLDIEQLKLTARYHGLELDSLVDYEQWLRPMVFKRLPVVAFNVYEMDFPHKKHENLHYVGPMIFEQRCDPDAGSGGDQDSINKWCSLRDSYKNKQTKQPLIYCSLGTFWRTDQAFLSRVIDVFEKRQDWHLVIGLGGKSSVDAFEPLPDNVTILKWAPQLQILEWADCVVTHGGITSINECVHYEVPMLVYSTAHGDQNGCATRVAWHGLGIMGDKALDDTEQMQAHIDLLLNDSKYKHKLAIMRSHFQRYSDENRAVKLIEQIVKP